MIIDDQQNIQICLEKIFGILENYQVTIIPHLNEIEAYRDFITRNFTLTERTIDIIVLDNNLD